MSNKTRQPRPLRAYKAPYYPEISDIGRDDLARPPARWARLKSVVASLGTVAMTMKALAQDAAQVEEPKTALSPEAPKAEKPAKAEAAAVQPATDVCPLLPVAVAGEGRGAFGCVSINPPVMLSEGEALEIIEREFAKRGIVLKDCPELDGVELPSKPGKRQPVMVDLGSEQGDIFVEFISLADDGVWTDPSDSNVYSWLSVRDWDLRSQAERASKAFAARTTGKPVSVGVLYDPTVHMPDGWKPPKTEGSKEKQRADYWKARRAAGRKFAEEKLVAQLEGFFAHLASQGKLPKAKKDAPDASSH